MLSNFKVFTGRANPKLAQKMCDELGIPLSRADVFDFPNDNTFVKLHENVRGKDVFIVQPSVVPVNTRFMELLLLIDAAKHASADRVTAVLPYFPYVRSDKKDQPRISIAARLVADLLECAGADRILTMNLHSWQAQGFFRVPTDHILADDILLDHFRKKDLRNFTVVAPDAGAAKRTESYARRLGLPLAILDKRRLDNSGRSVEVQYVIGEVKGKKAIVFDDEIATAGSLLKTVDVILAKGAEEVYAGAVHPVFCGEAIKRINASPLKEVVVTDTIPVPQGVSDKIVVLSVAHILADAVRRIAEGESVSDLFKDAFHA